MEIRQDAESGKFNGEAATIKVGTVTSGELPQVENEGTLQDAIFNFVLPRGERGPEGPQGPEGPPGAQGEPGKDGVQIDDAAVSSTETWSSRKIIDTLCPEFSVSGNPVTCTPVEGYPLGAVVTLEPKQAGSGDPSPENVRPITGRDRVKVTVSNESESRDYDLTLPETVYGGTVDAVTGVGSDEWKLIEFDGTENWLADANGDRKYFSWAISQNLDDIPSSTDKVEDAKLTQKCSHFVIENAYSTDAENCMWVYSIPRYNIPTVRLRSTANFTTVDELKSYLAAQAAGTPVQVAYKLADPVLIQATGGQMIPALPGENALFTDGDSLTVTGKTDPLITIEKLTERIIALEQNAIGGIV